MTVQTHPQESLSQALGAIFQRQLVAFLVVWLTVGFPVMCQVHGMMSMYELEPHEHMGQGGTANDQFPCSLSDHSTAPSMTMLLSLVTSLIPDQVLCGYIPAGKTMLPFAIRWPLQLTAMPLEQPPRSL